MGFVSIRQGQLPSYAQGPQGQAYQAALGAPQDAELRVLKDVVLMRNPVDAPDDGLAPLGRFYALPEFAADTTASYRARLQAAWPTWLAAGTAPAIVASLHAFGFGDVQVFADWQGTFWPGDWYTRFWVLLGPDMGSTGIVATELGVNLVLGQTPLGSTMTEAQQVAVKQQILFWTDLGGYPVDFELRFAAGDQLLGVDFALGVSLLGGVTGQLVSYPIGKLVGTPQTRLGGWTLGGYLET